MVRRAFDVAPIDIMTGWDVLQRRTSCGPFSNGTFKTYVPVPVCSLTSAFPILSDLFCSSMFAWISVTLPFCVRSVVDESIFAPYGRISWRGWLCRAWGTVLFIFTFRHLCSAVLKTFQLHTSLDIIFAALYRGVCLRCVPIDASSVLIHICLWASVVQIRRISLRSSCNGR